MPDIDSLITSFDDLALHLRKLAKRHVPVLAYADDVLLLSRTQVGMRRALCHLALVSSQEKLIINSEKTKVLVFARGYKAYRWSLNGKPIDQVKLIKYLGVTFHYQGGRLAHKNYVTQSAQKTSNVIYRFYSIKDAKFLPVALKLHAYC